ncbi:hypothetical protein T4E_12203 [Trichinella pseudospiralis]|uniref:Uncharacterized protein n=1 Tax=Trichinella pseudospiralis TaxID=6337 RepID=A0A0V0YGM1_TRIPS|nr:hypothetical protein T4E_12203 [Trichinella pseudospiralis]
MKLFSKIFQKCRRGCEVSEPEFKRQAVQGLENVKMSKLGEKYGPTEILRLTTASSVWLVFDHALTSARK